MCIKGDSSLKFQLENQLLPTLTHFAAIVNHHYKPLICETQWATVGETSVQKNMKGIFYMKFQPTNQILTAT